MCQSRRSLYLKGIITTGEERKGIGDSNPHTSYPDSRGDYHIKGEGPHQKK